MTAWLPIDDPSAPARAAEVIRAGGLIVLPTDTVYGVAADLWQPEAVAALYAAKARPPAKAIPVLLAGEADAAQVACHIPPLAGKLAAAFWPGPLTIALPRRESVPDIVSSLPTVGVRVPDHDGARAVIRACGGALAVTSANRSGEPGALTARQAADALGGQVALVLDGGRCSGGVPSTVVDASGEALQIIRIGPLNEATLRAALRDG
jgi:L-threonylcarbamoyladenylate synthase